MIRLLPRPALLTSVVVAVSVAGGMAFGVAAVAGALALRGLAQNGQSRQA